MNCNVGILIIMNCNVGMIDHELQCWDIGLMIDHMNCNVGILG